MASSRNDGDAAREPLLDPGFKPFCSRWGIIDEGLKPKDGPKAKDPSIWRDLLNDRRQKRAWYIFLLIVSTLAVISQFALGVTTSVLSGINPARFKVAIIIIGALNSFVGAVSGWLQYQGEPMRSGRFADALNLVRLEVLDAWGDLRDSGTQEDGEDKALKLKEMYKQAILDSLANQPGVWQTNTKPNPQPTGPSEKDIQNVKGKMRSTDRMFDGRSPDRGGRDKQFRPNLSEDNGRQSSGTLAPDASQSSE